MARLAPRELAQSRAVCWSWREAASSLEVRRAAFIQHWQLGGLVGEARNVVGEARNATLMDTATLAHFVRRHPVVRTDSLTALAVRHGCGVTAIKRLNNLISDHSLHSREAVFLPVSSAAEVCGSHALFQYCREACRELLVLLSDREAQTAREALQGSETDEAGGGGPSKGKEEALQGKLVALLGRSLRLDDATARFYLAEAGWCLKKAVALCEQDVLWESRTPGSRCRRRGPILALGD